MKHFSDGIVTLALFAGLGCGLVSAADEEAGKIMRPVDGAAFAANQVDIIATAPSGKLQLDGQPITVEEPFPNVFHTVIKVSSGIHTLSLLWEGEKKEIRFFAGGAPPSGFAPFHQHPPVPGVQCTQCHEVNSRGRFRFKGGCFDCHQRDGFSKIHTHTDAILSQCGTCHNAHGSTVKANLLYPKEDACRLCHD
jgi:predicted CXXCH cytochrome family protein